MAFASEFEFEDELELEQWDETGAEQESEYEFPLTRILPWYRIAKKLYGAGRLGWRGGRWIDKQTGRAFGKPLSQRLGQFLYDHLGRSRRLEDFFDRLPRRVQHWLYSL